MNGKDYYKLLEVPRTATAEELKKAHHRLARKYHPDLQPPDKKAEASKKFNEMQEAYDVLSDAEKRRKYDQFGANWENPGFGGNPGAGAGTGGFNPGAGFGGFQGAPFDTADSGGGINLEDLMEKMFGGGSRSSNRRSAAPAEDVEFGLEISLEEAYRGATRRINVTVQDACPDCDGMGQKRDSKGRFDLSGAPCPRCRGNGRIPAPRTGQVTIPAGAWEGLRLKVAGEGAADAKGRRGDLFVQLHILPNAKFERDGQNLQFDVAVPCPVAALGGEVTVEMLDGKRRQLLVPPGIQTGQKMRLSGQGMPALSDKPAGDAYARVKITVPKDLSERERALFTELASIRNDSIKK